MSNSGGVMEAKEKLIKSQKKRGQDFGKELDKIVADSNREDKCNRSPHHTKGVCSNVKGEQVTTIPMEFVLPF